MPSTFAWGVEDVRAQTQGEGRRWGVFVSLPVISSCPDGREKDTNNFNARIDEEQREDVDIDIVSRSEENDDELSKTEKIGDDEVRRHNPHECTQSSGVRCYSIILGRI